MIAVEQRRDASETAHSVRSGEAPARRPLLVYVNIPFCKAKCHFCYWVAEVPREDLRLTPADSGRSRYIEAVTEQIKAQSPVLRRAGYQPRLMYWGGGTASILTGDEIRRISESLQAELDLSGVVEATLESSPETLDLDKCRLARSLGFNRVSIGVQTFDDARLRKIGRIHSASQAAAAVETAAAAGFDNINIDLIVGFPGQPRAEIENNVRVALSLPVNHFSIYVYYDSAGTVMSRQIERGLPVTDPVEQVEQYCLARDMLEAAGFPEYGAGYLGSPPGQADQAYYSLAMDWIGFGSGAGSLLGQRLITNTRGNLHRYNQDPTVVDVNAPASTEALVLKAVYEALGTYDGVRADLLQRGLGISLAEARELPRVKAYLENVQRHAELISDEAGIRIRREELVPAWYLTRPATYQGAQN